MKRSGPKVVIVGASGTGFRGVVADLVASPDFDAEVVLVGRTKTNLDTMTRLARRMTRTWKSKTKVQGTTDRRAALAGADFVILAIAVGGIDTWRMDEEIGHKHGFQGHTADTVGPGGLFRGLRLIPPLVETCRDVEQLCPRALVLNYSNPVTSVCRAIHKATRVNVVGLCNVADITRGIGKLYGVEPERVTVVSAGVNHWVWVLRLFVDGKDVYADFKRKMRREQYRGPNRSSVELMEVYGYWPMPWAGHVAECFPWFYGEDPDGRSEAEYPYRKRMDFDNMDAGKQALRLKLKAQSLGKEPLEPKPDVPRSVAANIITTMWKGGRTSVFANLRNDGLVGNILPEAVVEVPAVVDATGVRGLPVGNLPAGVTGWVQARLQFFELMADAALEKSKALALQCLLADTNTRSLRRARACVDEMFERQARWLPGYR